MKKYYNLYSPVPKKRGNIIKKDSVLPVSRATQSWGIYNYFFIGEYDTMSIDRMSGDAMTIGQK
jgi:hypothetical protein